VPDSAQLADQVLPVLKKFTATELVQGGRIDAIRQLEDSVVLCATRGLNKGKLFVSYDYGNHWQLLAQPTTSEITCIAETGRRNEFYILTGKAEVFGTADGGKTWAQLATLLTANKNREKYTASYAIMYTSNGTLLVTDTDSDGGHIYRSADKGRNWKDLGAISHNALYRLEKVGNGIIVNGWEGNIYKSTDDGLTWIKTAELSKSALFATEYLGHANVLQADQYGNLYRSTNLGDTWQQTGNLADAADDFINAGYGAVYYGTYTGKKKVYVSLDYGKRWWSIDTVPTQVAGDWLDHGISVHTADSVIILAGTNKGFIIRNAISKKWLYTITNQYNDHARPVEDAMVKSLQSAMVGYTVNYTELNEPEDIVTHNHFAYIPCRDGNNVAIFDYRDPAHPVLAHSLRDADILDAFSVAIKGQFLYVLSMTNCRISVYNIKDPYHPAKVTAFTVGGQGGYVKPYQSSYTRLRKLRIEGNYAYVTHSSESKVYIIDISKPAAPVIVSSFYTGDGAFALLVNGNALYLAGYGPGASVIAVDISDKYKPVIKSRIRDTALLDGTCALAIQNNQLYVTAYHANTFWVFDITDPFSLKPIVHISAQGMKGPGRVAIKDHTAYILNSVNDAVAAVDIHDPAHPAVLYYIQDFLVKQVYGIAIDGNLLLLAGRQGRSFVVVDLNRL
jgi:photosystem II stability/assembly factor-like uncharacterized protein